MKILILILFILFSDLFANSQQTFQIEKESFQEDMTQYLWIFEDPTKELEFSQILDKTFQPVTNTNLGYTNSAFWLRWEVENKLSHEIEIYFTFESTVIDYFYLFSLSEGTILQSSGDWVPFYNRSLNYRNPNFKVIIAPNSKEVYYLNINSESTIPIHLKAYSRDILIEHIIHEQIIFGLYYGWMLVMALYNLVLYLSDRYKTYIFYVLFISSYSLFQFILNGFAFQYFYPNIVGFNDIALLVFMNLATMFGILFSTHYLKTRQTIQWIYRIYQILWIIGGILLISVFILSYSLMIRLTTVYVFIAALVIILNGIVSYLKETNTAKSFLIANSLLVIGAIFYTAKSLGLVPSNILTNWTIQVGSAIQVALLSLGLADRIKELSVSLNTKSIELDETTKKLSTSENRFQRLFNGLGDIIFVLDENWNFIEINKSITKHLGFKPEEVIGKNILEMIYKSGDIKDTYNRIFVMEKLEELHDTKAPVDFQAEFRQKYVMEPKEFYVKLQYGQMVDKIEILGSASVIVEDILNRYLQKERASFEIENLLRNAEILSNKLTQHLQKFTDPTTIMAIRTALREIIINAIEHGNLGITYIEKTKAMQEGNYLQFIQSRQNDPRYKNKTVKIEYVLDEKKVAYRITDQGKGFDHKKIMKKDVDNLNKEFSQHGRGIIMTRDVFDIIEYNDKGNQVSLIKFFKNETLDK